MNNLAMDVTVILFSGALFLYAIYLNVIAPITHKATDNEKK